MEGIDKITLELLMNKSQYSKYLAINNPRKYNELQEHLAKVAQYRDRIMQITHDYCEDHATQNSVDLNDAFSNYVKSCIRFIEMKELENQRIIDLKDKDLIIQREINEKNTLKTQLETNEIIYNLKLQLASK